MTPYSFQSVPVPDRYISRLRHSQSGTRGKRVKDLSLRAFQISCTLFHPFHCLSLPLFSFWMFHFSSPYTYLFSLFTSSGVFFLLPPSYPLNFPLFNSSLHPTILTFMFFFPFTLHIFPLYPSEIGLFLFFTSVLHKWHWRFVCDCM